MLTLVVFVGVWSLINLFFFACTWIPAFLMRKRLNVGDAHYFIWEDFKAMVTSRHCLLSGFLTMSTYLPDMTLCFVEVDERIHPLHYKKIKKAALIPSMYQTTNKKFLKLIKDVEQWKKNNDMNVKAPVSKEMEDLFWMNFQQRIERLENEVKW